MPIINSIGAISAKALGVFSGLVPQVPTIENNTEIYKWKCPAGVNRVSVVLVAGGGTGGLSYGAGGGGGALAYGNNIPVVPGQTYYVGVGLGGQNVSPLTANPTQYGFGGDSYFIDPNTLNAGGGKAGTAGNKGTPGGGGGAGGYAGAGGNGGAANIGTAKATVYPGGAGGIPSGKYMSGGGAGGAGGQASTSKYACDAATAGTGGASGGGAGGFGGALGGGGTGIDGQGTNGAGSSATTASGTGAKTQNGGSPSVLLTGSPAGYDNNTIPTLPGVPITKTVTQTIGGATSTTTYPDPFLGLPLCGGVNTTTQEGGMYGGGGGGTSGVLSGGRGVVRIIWGPNRSFPNTNVVDQPVTSSTGQATFIAQIGPVPLANWPIALNSNVTVYQNTVGDVINVSYLNPSNLTPSLYVTSPVKNGSIISTGSNYFQYTPATNFLGTDSMMYLVNNSYGNSFPAMVTINVISPDALTTLYLNCTIDSGGNKSNDYVTGTITNSTGATLTFGNTDGYLSKFGSNSTSISASLNWANFLAYVKQNNLTIDPINGVTIVSSFTITIAGGTSSLYNVIINVKQTTGPLSPTIANNCPVNTTIYAASFNTTGFAITDNSATASVTAIPSLGVAKPIYGNPTDGYDVRSDLSSLVVHAGVLTPGQIGIIQFLSFGQGTFVAGSTANGITSQASNNASKFCIIKVQLVQLISKPPALAITAGNIDPNTWTVGDATSLATYNTTVGSVTGGTGPYTYSVSGTIDPGLTLNPATGVLTGTPTGKNGLGQNFTITVTDSTGQTATVGYSGTMKKPIVTLQVTPAFTNSSSWTVGVPITPVTWTATGGTAPYTWSISGFLDPGLTLNPATGILTGTPTGTGTAGLSQALIITATDSLGNTGVASINGQMNPAAPASLTITPANVDSSAWQVGVAVNQTYVTTGGTGPYTYSISGVLDPGLTFNKTTGAITGTPTGTGSTGLTQTLTITVTDSHGITGKANISGTMQAASPSPALGCPTANTKYTTAVGGSVIANSNSIASITGSTTGSSVWGDNVYGYSTDSDISVAVVHAGLLSAGQTANILFTSLGNKPGPFPGNTANGITTTPWGSSWCAVTLSLYPPPPPTITITGINPASGPTGTVFTVSYTSTNATQIGGSYSGGQATAGLKIPNGTYTFTYTGSPGNYTVALAATGSVIVYPATATIGFTVTTAPAPASIGITSINPTSGPPGTLFTVTYVSNNVPNIRGTYTGGTPTPGLPVPNGTYTFTYSGNPGNYNASVVGADNNNTVLATDTIGFLITVPAPPPPPSSTISTESTSFILGTSYGSTGTWNIFINNTSKTALTFTTSGPFKIVSSTYYQVTFAVDWNWFDGQDQFNSGGGAAVGQVDVFANGVKVSYSAISLYWPGSVFKSP